jgi:formylmethanofuran dehydrogenase subunit E
MFNFNEIGVVKSAFIESADPFKIRESESIIEIKKEYEDGLYRLEESEYIEVIFCFHKSENYDLKLNNYYGEHKGVFATRSPRRPSNIGSSKVKLLRREGNILYIKGLDAIDGTPVLDIKPHDSGYIPDEKEQSELSWLKDNPRKRIIPLIKNNKLEDLLILSGTLHGHFCPGLSMGVIGATYAVNKMKESCDGMEEILAVIEINSCFADAVQYITGCTVGNNSLVYKDFGKTAFSLVRRDGTGVRLSSKPSFREMQRERNSEFFKYFNMVVVEQNRDEEVLSQFKKLAKEASFKLLEWDINEIFKIEEVKLKLPDYAPIRETVFCAVCGEGIMKGKEINENGKTFCKSCKEAEFHQLDGTGISINF